MRVIGGAVFLMSVLLSNAVAQVPGSLSTVAGTTERRKSQLVRYPLVAHVHP